jgi:putative PIN family toxin of toxin-antitoxin system
VSRELRNALLERLAPDVQLVEIVEIVEIVQHIQASRGPKDDEFLEAAINGEGQVVVSGDNDLLTLHPFCGIAILTPAEYLSRER